ncbi:c-type cytochrome [Caulobacter sp. KR2-114]|uniref:c-type cytochrome n=1 Tax=Caulobacter sp. KR2-114 TaxID=3400912 RepID=UPI003C10A760
MRIGTSVVVILGAASLLAACGKSGGASSTASADQPSAPAEPASAPAALTDAQKKALLAELPAAYQTADLDSGQAKFALCKSCHTAVKDGGDMTGPNLHGVFGRKAGSKEGFAYSDALKASGITWDADKLNQWLTNPKGLVPGTKMTFVGLQDPKDRTDLIAYLKTITSDPKS